MALLNFRDVGGLRASGNRKIKSGLIFRSANPDMLNRNDIKRLHSLDIRTVIDLRAPHELKKRSHFPENVEKLSLPLDFQYITRERLRPVIYRKDASQAIVEISNALYLEILDSSGPVIGKVMEVLASPAGAPVLIHCQAGKDRTGIVIALILEALGADRELIINDFMKSNEALLPWFRKIFFIRRILSLGFFPYSNMLFVVTVKQKNIESVLNRIDNYYGGIENYLMRAGLNPATLGAVRNRMLSD